MERSVHKKFGSIEQLDEMAHMRLSSPSKRDGGEEGSANYKHEQEAQVNDFTQGTLLRRSPRFDDDDIGRIYEDLGIIEPPSSRANAVVTEQENRSMTPNVSNIIHDVPSQAPNRPKEHEGYIQPRQMLLDHIATHNEEPESLGRSQDASQAPLMTAEIMYDFTLNDGLGDTVHRGEQYDVFGASRGFVGVQDAGARKKIWVPGWCCNVWPKKLDSE